MVRKVFIQTLIISLFIFSTGFYLGDYIESQRADHVQDLSFRAETNRLDLNTQISMFDKLDCDIIRSETIKLADDTYFDAIYLEKMEKSEVYSNKLYEIHRKYDLTRTIIWKITDDQSRCFKDYNIIVYLYKYLDPGYENELRQEYFTALTSELKSDDDRTILIPIAYDTDINSLKLMMNILEIDDETQLIINNEHFVSELISKDDLLNLINTN
jgi:hypothetical protein